MMVKTMKLMMLLLIVVFILTLATVTAQVKDVDSSEFDACTSTSCCSDTKNEQLTEIAKSREEAYEVIEEELGVCSGSCAPLKERCGGGSLRCCSDDCCYTHCQDCPDGCAGCLESCMSTRMDKIVANVKAQTAASHELDDLRDKCYERIIETGELTGQIQDKCSTWRVDLCKTRDKCKEFGGYWYVGECHAEKAVKKEAIEFKYTQEEIDEKLDRKNLEDWFNEKMKKIKTRTSWINPFFWWQHARALLHHGFDSDPNFVDEKGYGRCGDSMLWLRRAMEQELGLPETEATLSITGEKGLVFTHTSLIVRPKGISNEKWKNIVIKFKNLAEDDKDPTKEDLEEIKGFMVFDPYLNEVTNVETFSEGWKHIIIS